uniref:Uncharacterized protein n=1 Tax=Rhizophora mucronata TaxID=61149 RepID=A0A2P2PWI1_RHIMU
MYNFPTTRICKRKDHPFTIRKKEGQKGHPDKAYFSFDCDKRPDRTKNGPTTNYLTALNTILGNRDLCSQVTCS